MKIQSTIIAILLVLAGLFGGYELLSDRAAPAGESEHAEAEQHDDHDDGKEHAPAEKGKHADEHGPAAAETH